MIGGSPEDRRRAQKLVFNALWVGLLAGLVVLRVFLGSGSEAAPADVEASLLALSGLVPLVVSIVVRWLVLPRFTDAAKALPVFIIGIGTAEACGVFGIFFGGPWSDHLLGLGLLGIVQYAPFLLDRLFRQPSEFRRDG